ncbi:hypothetical protein TUM18999_26940 [Pseudomonas tohonis]|uniref:Lipoprotein n=1 Tax=Pseudomonas tohonis TaxID=2725477 RepID=A0A6J4E3I9_9PSED|nr:hypothetical protein [Pseudomonas tohonis]BCG24503.1 hypothetical protein TUM18999_26940 [Pseudomonas tohonis]GJN52139.1 hypothetical protein TUM20286_18910 [Pseudomonas tohonis]
MRPLLLLCYLSLTACQSKQIPANQTWPVPPERLFAYQGVPAEPSQYLIVNRDDAWWGRKCLASVYINGQLAVQLEIAESAAFQLPYGQWDLAVEAGDCGRAQLMVPLSNLAASRYRIAFDAEANVQLLPTEAGNSILCRYGGCGGGRPVFRPRVVF